MKKLQFDYKTEFELSAPVVDHRFQLRCTPPTLPQQRICDLELNVEPACELSHDVDAFANPVVCGRIVEPHSTFSYHVSGLAFVDQSLIRKMAYKPLYNYQSDFTGQGDELAAFTTQAREYIVGSPHVTSPIEQATAVMHMVHDRLVYQPGLTTVQTTAEQALEHGAGVCQDYAQIAISVCRGLGLMAKYVAGVYDAEGATHAWMEVYQGGCWHPLDPTNDCVVNDSYIKIAHGRDSGDCKMVIGVWAGNADQQQNVHARVCELAQAEQ